MRFGIPSSTGMNVAVIAPDALPVSPVTEKIKYKIFDSKRRSLSGAFDKAVTMDMISVHLLQLYFCGYRSMHG